MLGQHGLSARSVDALCTIMLNIASSIAGVAAVSAATQSNPTHGGCSGNEETQTLCIAIRQVVIPALRHCTREPASTFKVGAFFRLLAIAAQHAETEQLTLELARLGKTPLGVRKHRSSCADACVACMSNLSW